MNLKLVIQIAFTVTITFATAAVRSTVVNNSANGEAKKTGTNVTKTKRDLHVRDQNTETETKSVSQKLFVSRHDLGEYVSKQIDHVYEILEELTKSNDSQKVLWTDMDQVPTIVDRFYVGAFNKTYKLAEMRYTNVKVYGMSDFENCVISAREQFRKAQITLVANQLKIEGYYSVSNYLKHASGSFVVKLLNNITYTENDSYSKFKNEIDIVAGEATITYGKLEYDYRNASVISAFFEGVVSNKLTEEVLYRVSKELAHRIRPFTILKIKQTTSRRNETSLTRYNRVSSIVQSIFSQIRTWLAAIGTIKAPLPGVYHKLKVYNNFILVSDVTLTGLNTMHLSEQITALKEKNDFRMELRGQAAAAGPLIINGKTVVTEARNGTLVQVPLNFAYQVFGIRARIVLSNSLLNDENSLQVSHSNVNISRVNLRMQPAKIDFKRDELEQLAEFLKPSVETELHKWLKDFVNDIFKRAKSSDADSSH